MKYGKIVLAAALMTGVAACDVDVEKEGELPEVNLEGETRLPDVDVSVEGGNVPERSLT